QQDLAHACRNFATLLQLLNRPGEAEKLYRRAASTLTQLAQKYPGNPDYRFELAMTNNNLADLLKTPGQTVVTAISPNPWAWIGLGAVPAGRRAEAEQAWRSAIDQLTQLSKEFPTIPAYQKECA